MIADQKKEEGDALVTTVLFDHRYNMIHDGVNIKEVENMTTNEYMPSGMTAMLDAVGRTVNHVGQKLASMPEEERPEKVIFTIVTDGAENSSKEFNWETVRNMIKHQREKYSWVFTFLGANIDVDRVSDNLGIDKMLSKRYTASKIGTQKVFNATSKTMSFASCFGKYKDRYTPLKNGNRAVCVCAQSIIIASSTKRESTVAIAAPSTPSFGKPSFPKIRSQLNTRFTSTAAPLPIMGTTVSPVSRKLDA